jgi:hypothetical protein
MSNIIQKNTTKAPFSGMLILNILVTNVVPLVGVLFWGWDTEKVLLTYLLETIVVGLVHALRLCLVHFLFRNRPEVLARAEEIRNTFGPQGMEGGFLILFFLFHFFFFVAVQSMVLGGFTHGSMLSIIRRLAAGLDDQSLTPVLLSFLGIQLVYLLNELLSGKYSGSPLSTIFFQPYKRIVIQQFMVILGGFLLFMGFQNFGYLLVLVFVKTVVELLITFSGSPVVRRLATQGDPEKEKQWDDFNRFNVK